MILMNLKLDNCYNFSMFEGNFSFPRKIVNSTLGEETLPGHSNFRFLKAVVLTGSNATGKTCLGRAIKNVCEFLETGNLISLSSMVNDKTKPMTIAMEFINEGDTLKEVSLDYDRGGATISFSSAAISDKDSYETVHAKLSKKYQGVYSDELRSLIGPLCCRFAYPEIERSLQTSGIDETIFLRTLKAVIGTLDPSLKKIRIAKGLKHSFVIERGDSEIIIQDGRLLNKDLLSSGTIEGVDVSLFLAAMMGKEESFYYCDEHFSYIDSEVEKSIFALMIKKLKDREQLIFTTHNIDMLDINIPKHSFAFLRRDAQGRSQIVFASSELKRNTDSVRCATLNDVFCSLTDLSLLDNLD